MTIPAKIISKFMTRLKKSQPDSALLNISNSYETLLLYKEIKITDVEMKSKSVYIEYDDKENTFQIILFASFISKLTNNNRGNARLISTEELFGYPWLTLEAKRLMIFNLNLF